VSGLHVTYLVLSALVALVAVVTAWKSAERVIPENRGWTRAWRIGVVALAAGPSGWLVPVGAIYTLVRYRKRPARAVSAEAN